MRWAVRYLNLSGQYMHGLTDSKPNDSKDEYLVYFKHGEIYVIKEHLLEAWVDGEWVPMEQVSKE